MGENVTIAPGGGDTYLSFLQLPPEGRKCLEDFWSSLPLEGVYCNATWDTLHCWPATRAGETVTETCRAVFTDVPTLRLYPEAVAYRECDGTGQWRLGGWTNYSQCLSVIEHQVASSGVVVAVRYVTFLGALLSLLTLTITIFIFTYYRSLECDRLRVHRNLVVALIVRFVVMLVLTEPFVSHRTTLTYRDFDWLCKTLLALRMYTQMASINWMFVEGLFLHTRLTSKVFPSRAPFPLYYTIGWGAPLVFLVGWSSTMAVHHPVHCWRGYGDLPYIWILVGPMVTALLMNLLFLINIIRILVTKLSAGDATQPSTTNKTDIQRTNSTSTTKHRQKHQSHPVLQQIRLKPRSRLATNASPKSRELPDENLSESPLRHIGKRPLLAGQQQWSSSCSFPSDSESSNTHSRESSPLLLHRCSSKTDLSMNRGGRRQQQQQPTRTQPHPPPRPSPEPERALPRPPPHRLSRSVHTNSLQHYHSVGYAANRPEFNIRKAIRATVVLFPLLGITNLLFAVNPGDKGDLEGAYMLTNAFLQSSQGVFVSVLYCFLNSEVKEVLRKRWRQYRTRQSGCRRGPSGRKKSTRCTLFMESSLCRHSSPAQISSPTHLLSHATPTSSNNSVVSTAVETTLV